MRYLIIKITLLVLVLYVGKAPALAQDQDPDIKCEVGSLDLNISGNKAMIDFGNFFVSTSEHGEKSLITKYYKLPRTELILSVLAYVLRDYTSVLVMEMILGKKRVLVPSSNLDEEEVTKNVVSNVQVGYPIDAFDRGGEGLLSTAFLGKKKPVHIMTKCKKMGP